MIFKRPVPIPALLCLIGSIDQGPFQLGVTRDTLGTTPEGGILLEPERARTYDDLNDNEKKRFDADVRATNIVLQGLPKDIYKLINHNTEAKAIWDNVKMLLAGSELTQEDRESQLYDESERFKMLPGENINEYYVRFHKLVNDMRNIRMTMPNIQLNSKFVNNMSPKWGRFVTAVKLNKGLKETNHEQLYAYLKQHEKHVAQDRLIIKRITPPTNDPLTFISSVQPYSQPSQSQATLPQTNNQLRTSSNTRNQATIQEGQIVVQNVQGQQNQNQRYFAQGNGAAGFGGTQNRAGNANAGQGKPIKCYNCNGIGHIAQNCTHPKRPQNSDYFKDKMLLMQAQENGAVLDEEELLFLVGEQPNTFDADVDNQPVRDLARNEDNIFQADECDAFDSDVDDEPAAQSIFMANLNNDQVGYEIHSEVQQSTVIDSNNADMGNSNVIPYEQYLTTNDVYVVPTCASSTLNTAYVLIDNNVHTPNEPLVTELAIYKEQFVIYEQRAKFELTKREQRMDDQMRILIQDRNRMEEKIKQELHSVKLQLNHSIKLKDKLENKLHIQDQSIQTVHMMLKPKKLCEQYSEIVIGAQNPFYLRNAKVAQPTLYDGNEIINPDHDPTNVPSSEEDLELAELARQKMHEKMNDPVCVEKRIKCIPPNYSKENFLATFTPHTQLNPEQVFWSIDLEKRKAEELKANTSPLPVLPPATVVQKLLVTEVRAMKAVFENMEAEVDQNAVDKKCGEIERKNLLITNENLIVECLSKDVFYTATDSVLNVSRFSDMHDAFTIAQKRIVDLESENFNLRNKIQYDDHDSMIKHFSKLEVEFHT
ncbi:retrovirus-related pol polyprotein from transposon TNT 1-94 [Tanacetum coccineum]